MSKLRMIIKISYICTFLILLAQKSQAYIGPGMGTGAIITVFAFLGAILIAVFAMIFYPIKRLFRRISKFKGASNNTSDNCDR